MPTRLRFGAFELDLKGGELWKGDARTRLANQPLQLLLMLLDRAGKVVTREEIKKKLWPNDTIVEFDQSIHSAIRKLRLALGDSADDPKYIETVGRRGYRFLIVALPLDSSSGDSSATTIGPLESSGLVGKQVSHYRVLDVIGGGGMGMVYRAEDLKLGRRVALKFLPEEMADDPVALQRFEREARTASSLNHPNICSIHEFGEHEGQPFLVMELLEGETLRDRLAATASIGATMLDELSNIATQVADGLEAAHEQGIIHRDIKPANVFLTRKGTTKILDFGLAKLAQAAIEEDRAVLQADARGDHNQELITEYALTRTGTAMGTAGYMSPEQVRGETLDWRTDLFSFGLVLYEMACGQRAFTGETVAILKDSILHCNPTPLRELNAAVSPKLEQIIGKALEKDRERRYQSAAEMRGALQGIAGSKTQRPLLWKMPAAVVVLIATVSAVVYWRRSTEPPIKLTANDTIVLAEFSNSTGDSILDGTLRQALDLDLQQSPAINVLSERKISEALKAMGHSSGESLTSAVARQVCLQTQSTATLTGTIANQGNRYVIRLAAQDCKTGRDLTVLSAEAQNRDQVIHVLGEAGTKLRRALGDPTVEQPEFNRPLEDETTGSLDAMQEYARALAPAGSGELKIHLQRAVELDPNFALVYQQLGRHSMAGWQSEQAAESFTKAYALRARLSLRHRLGIEASYYLGASGELDQAVRSFSELLRTFPESGARNQLCFTLRRTGHLEQAVAACREAMRFNRNEVSPFANAIYIYVALDRLADAQSVLDEAQTAIPNLDNYTDAGYTLAFAQGDQAAMRKYFESATALGGMDAGTLFYMEACTQTYYGRVEAAQKLWQRAITAINPKEFPETVAGFLAREALDEAEVGDKSRAASLASDALALSDGRDVKATVAFALARSGYVARAQKLAEQLSRDFPRDTLIQFLELPLIRASLAIDNHQPTRALEALQAAAPYQTAMTPLLPYGLASYVRGEAFLQARQGKQAAAESQKVLTHPGLVGNRVHGPLARLQLARAQAMLGDKTAARQSYQEFLLLWREADRDVPIFRQAKAEYAELQ